MDDFRIEKDPMGELRLPARAYWGAQTQRAIENFPVSGLRLPRSMIRSLGLVKRYAAEVNAELNLLEPLLAQAIIQAAEEVISGQYDAHFPVDVFQTGSGTSSNMNANEVIANRANEILGAPLGSRNPVHPNDHVNQGQSSNDVIPTAIHIAARQELQSMVEDLRCLRQSLLDKAEEFQDVIKTGRTHLQDALPITLGQEFSGYASQVEHGIRRIVKDYPHLEELALGGTAVGTGLNAHREFASRVVQRIAERVGIPFTEAHNRFEALAARDALVELMGTLNTLAVSLMKIANDLRLLSSGPRTGFAELIIPSLQLGSSIMPGKVNPVIPEMMIQVAAQVMGNHLAVTIGGQNGPLELNMMMPLMAHNVLFSIEILKSGVELFEKKCVSGVSANGKRCRELVEQSLALVTPLASKIGYDRAARIAHRAYEQNKTILRVVVEEGILTEKEARELLDPARMLGAEAG